MSKSNVEINRPNLEKKLFSELEDSILVGCPGAHDQENILRKTSDFLEGVENETYNYLQIFPDNEIIDFECLKKQSVKKRGYQHGLILPEVSKEKVIEILNEICGLPKDLKPENKEAWVTKEAFIERLIEAVTVTYETAVQGGTFIFGTGHPNLMKAYAYIIKIA